MHMDPRLNSDWESEPYKETKGETWDPFNPSDRRCALKEFKGQEPPIDQYEETAGYGPTKSGGLFIPSELDLVGANKGDIYMEDVWRRYAEGAPHPLERSGGGVPVTIHIINTRVKLLYCCDY